MQPLSPLLCGNGRYCNTSVMFTMMNNRNYFDYKNNVHENVDGMSFWLPSCTCQNMMMILFVWVHVHLCANISD